jgi:large subunit ribosomal protein L4
MASATRLDATGTATGTVDLPEIFDAPLRPSLIHLAVRSEQAARRQGTHKTKRRSEVSGGGKKPYRQKGTGRARQGSIRAPQFVGGGTVWGPQPHDYNVRINRRERHAAFNGALGAHATRGSVAVAADGFGLDDTPKTKVARAFVDAWLGDRAGESTLVVLGAGEAAERAFRNLAGVTVATVPDMTVEAIVAHRHLLFSADGLAALPSPRARQEVTA